jgi:hypothetical protein
VIALIGLGRPGFRIASAFQSQSLARMTGNTRSNVNFYPNGSERSMGTADSVKWAADVFRHPKDVLEILERHNK